MFHKWIAEELAKIKEQDLVEPEYEMSPKTDHVLGEMSEELRKLFTLYRKTGQATTATMKTARKAVKEILIELPEEANHTDLEKAEKKAKELEALICLAREREDAVREAFWISVKDEFPEAKNRSLAVCKGFKVALTEKEAMFQTVRTIIEELSGQ